MRQQVNVGTWIKIGPDGIALDGYVLRVYDENRISVGYYQNRLKCIEQEAIWHGEHWELKQDEFFAGGAYIHDPRVEWIVKRGPYR